MPVTGLPFKQLEVHDVFEPARVATFTRPRVDSDIIRITIGAEQFHCDAGTIEIIAGVMILPLKS